jgi:hypothetical protein
LTSGAVMHFWNDALIKHGSLIFILLRHDSLVATDVAWC